jgi:hypothetical protein
MCFAEAATEEETGRCTLGFEIEIVNYEIKDFFIVLQILPLDALQSVIQLDEGSGTAIWIRPSAIMEAHMESRKQRVAKDSRRDVEDGNLKVVLGYKAKGNLN